MPKGKPYYGNGLDLASEQLWELTADAVRNRDFERLNEVIHKLCEYHGYALHDEPVIT